MQLNSLVFFDPILREPAQLWANRFGLLPIDGSSVATKGARELHRFLVEQCNHQPGGFVLALDTHGLALYAVDPDSGSLSIQADFHGPSVTYRRKKGGGKKQMIARAVGIRGSRLPSVLDATAGLGSDAFVLASLGCEVTLLERVGVVYALLEDGIAQARRHGVAEDTELLEILDCMRLVESDAQNYMNECPIRERPDVVYLDPMFPVRAKTSKVGKEMQVFHTLMGPEDDAGKVLEGAVNCARQRGVVKRPRKGPALSGLAPSHSLEGKRNRYDVYML